MQGAQTQTWKCWALAALSLVSCRAHTELCEDDTCTEPAIAAQGGAPNDEPVVAGASGSPAEDQAPDCTEDAGCDDGSACNGPEHCEEGRCVSGDELACSYGTACVDAEPELCVYEHPSPWLVATSLETVLGLPLDQLEQGGEMAVLGQRKRTALLTGFDYVWWSPDGKFALVRSFEDRMGSRLHMMRFGAGLPSELQSIPGLPNWGDFWDEPVFTADSARVVIVDNYSGSYVVDLTTDPVTTTLGSIDVPEIPDAMPQVVTLCASADAWLAVDDDYEYFLMSRSGEELSSIPLGGGGVTVSPDGRLVAVKIEGENEDDATVELRPCSAETWVAPLGPGHRLEFSPDSRALALELTEYDGGTRVVSLVDPEHPDTIWSDVTAGPPLADWFTPDSKRLIAMLVAADGDQDDDPTPHILNLTNGEIKPLGLGPYSRVVAMGERALLAWSEDFASSPRDLLWQAFDREGAPLVISSDSDQQETHLDSVRFDRQSVFVWRTAGEETVFGKLRFDASAPESGPTVNLPGSVHSLEGARDRRAIVLSMVQGLTDAKLFWIGYDEQGEAAEPRLLAENATFLSIQP